MFWSATPEPSQSHLPWIGKQHHLKDVGISSILTSVLFLWGIFEFLWNKQYSWASFTPR